MTMWWSLVAAAAPTILGEPTFRAPDGVGAALVADDGAVWVMSAQGEITGFDRAGAVRHTFQACEDRGVHLDFAMDPRATRLGVDCGPTYRVFRLPAGDLLFEVDAFATHSAFSPDGGRLALLGERIVGDTSEDASYLLRYDATSGKASDPIPSDWEALIGVRGGWIGATTRENPGGPLYVEGRIKAGDSVIEWNMKAPEDRRTTPDWDPRRSIATMDGGAQVCVMYDYGGICLDGRTGGPRNFWSVPTAERSESTRAVPHPDGLAVGDDLWFRRGEGIWRWPISEDPQRMAAAADVPVADRAGRHRYRVEAARIVPVDASGSDTLPDAWGLPVSVSRSANGSRLVVVDDQQRVYVRDATGTRRLETRAERAVIAPDGNRIWLFTDEAPTVVEDLATNARERNDDAAVAFGPDGAVWTVSSHEGLPWLKKDGTPVTPVAEALEVTDLKVSGDTALVAYGQDDAWQRWDGEKLSELGTQTFSDRTDVVLTDAGVFGVLEGPAGWRVGNAHLVWTSTVRWMPDGASYVVLPDDGTTVEVRSHPEGKVTTKHDLPGRWSNAWVDGSGIVIALRDGRLVLL